MLFINIIIICQKIAQQIMKNKTTTLFVNHLMSIQPNVTLSIRKLHIVTHTNISNIMNRSHHNQQQEENYDEEAYKLFKLLNIDIKNGFKNSQYDDLNVIYCNINTGCKVYCGNITAASSMSITSSAISFVDSETRLAA